MKVSDILRVKGGTLYTASPDDSLERAIAVMAEKDIGSLVVMEHGQFVGMLTFREVIFALSSNGPSAMASPIRTAVGTHPMTLKPEFELDEVRRVMLECRARYLPVMDGAVLMGVISFHDVARAVVESQDFENQALKAYIGDMRGGAGTQAGVQL